MRGGRKKAGVPVPLPIEGPAERVVAIGSSAGGLKALSELFECLPGHTGLAFILIQHLQPTRATLLPSLLTKRTLMPIHEAEDGMLIESDHVYVIPHSANMTIEKGVQRLSPCVENLAPHHPIDCFMRSLAEGKRSNAIGVIPPAQVLTALSDYRRSRCKGGSPSLKTRIPQSTMTWRRGTCTTWRPLRRHPRRGAKKCLPGVQPQLQRDSAVAAGDDRH